MEEIEVRISSNGTPVKALQFADYFRYLRACYVLALREEQLDLGWDKGEVLTIEEVAESIAASISSRTESMSMEEYEDLVNEPLDADEDLWILHIQRRNPFDVVFLGMGVALTAALIISGGKFQFTLTGLKIEIPPLGEGIKKIKAAIKYEPPKSKKD